MALSDAEKYVLKRGLLGCPLKTIPKELFTQILESKNLQIVKSKDSQTIPVSLNDPDYLSAVCYKQNEIDKEEDYCVRPAPEFWRKVMFGKRLFHSGNLSFLLSMLLNHPEGLTRKQIKSQIPNSEKILHKWVKALSDINVIYIKSSEKEEEVICFNFGLIDDPDCASESKITEQPKIIAKEKKDPSNIVDKAMIEKSIDVIKDHQNGIPIKSLKTFLNVDDSVIKLVVDKFKDMEHYEVIEKNGQPQKIQHIGSLRTEYVDCEMVEFLLNMCRTLKIILMSEQPKELKELKAAMGITDDKLIEILGDNDFEIIEIRYKYMNSDFVAFLSDIEETDQSLIDTFEKAKLKLARYFKSKIQNIFLRNVYLTAFDNNYSSLLNERVKYFYDYLSKQMNKNDMFFIFTQEKLMDMNFYIFIKSVPLRSEFHFLTIMYTVIKIKNPSLIADDPTDYENLDIGKFRKLNDKYLELSRDYTLREVLSCLKNNSIVKKNLLSRISIAEFERTLLALIKNNIFEGFSDSKHIYFEAIDGIHGYVDKLLNAIDNEVEDQTTKGFVEYPIRKQFYDSISEYSPDEFYEKAKILIEETYQGNEKEFFMKRLQGFE